MIAELCMCVSLSTTEYKFSRSLYCSVVINVLYSYMHILYVCMYKLY